MQKGQCKGLSKGAHFVHFGEFGMQVLERGWITNQQIEAARIAINRYFQRRGKVWIRILSINPARYSLLRRVMTDGELRGQRLRQTWFRLAEHLWLLKAMVR